MPGFLTKKDNEITTIQVVTVSLRHDQGGERGRPIEKVESSLLGKPPIKYRLVFHPKVEDRF